MTNLKAIFHIDEPEKWGLVLANVTNLLDDLGEGEITVVVLANSVAVRNYVANVKTTSILEKVEELSKRGVSFKACRNAVVASEIDEKILAKSIEVVPAGVSELIKKQAEGYGYIRP